MKTQKKTMKVKSNVKAGGNGKGTRKVNPSRYQVGRLDLL